MNEGQLMGDFESESKQLEAESWSRVVDSKFLKQQKKDAVKRQEVIYGETLPFSAGSAWAWGPEGAVGHSLGCGESVFICVASLRLSFTTLRYRDVLLLLSIPFPLFTIAFSNCIGRFISCECLFTPQAEQEVSCLLPPPH